MIILESQVFDLHFELIPWFIQTRIDKIVLWNYFDTETSFSLEGGPFSNLHTYDFLYKFPNYFLAVALNAADHDFLQIISKISFSFRGDRAKFYHEYHSKHEKAHVLIVDYHDYS